MKMTVNPLTGLPQFTNSDTTVIGRGGGVTNSINNMPKPSITNESGTTRTLALDDSYDYIRLSHATSCDVTVPDNADVAFPINTQIFIRSAGTGTYTIVEDTSVTVNPPVGGSLVLAGDVTLIKVATDEWDLVGATA